MGLPRLLAELSIRVSTESFLETAEKVPNTTNCHTLEYTDTFVERNEKCIKIMAELNRVENKVRMIQCAPSETSYGNWFVYPEDTTHLHYEEFIPASRLKHPNRVDDFAPVPVKIVDGEMFYFKESEQEWVRADNGCHVIDAIRFHDLDWIEHDFKNPRSRTMPIIMQIYDCLESNDCYFRFEDTSELENWDELNKDFMKLFIAHLRLKMHILIDKVNTKEDIKRLIDIIIETKGQQEDVGYDIFADFVSAYESLLKTVMDFVYNSDYKFKE